VHPILISVSLSLLGYQCHTVTDRDKILVMNDEAASSLHPELRHEWNRTPGVYVLMALDTFENTVR
jgi:hypothetical protein